MPTVLPFNLQTATGGVARPWLILGKGPSAAGYGTALAQTHHVFALNHAMRSSDARVGHTLDIEVIEHLGTEGLAGVEWLVLPWVPHVRQARPLYGGKAYFGPGRQTLIEHAQRLPLLADYMKRGRLMAYNFSTAPPSMRHAQLPSMEGAYSFSAAVALQLLAQSGATIVRTLGVDGGTRYAGHYADLEDTTKLQTQQSSFDAQFQQMADTRRRYGINTGPLGDVPARVFVGCMPEQDLAYRVLDYSIQRHASMSVRVERLHDAIRDAGIVVPQPRDETNRGRTPFSFQRFAIPALCGYRGRAIYLDSDMLVLRDLRELWAFEMDGQQMVSAQPRAGSGRSPQFSVMLIDNHALRWDVRNIVSQLDEGALDYAAVMHAMATVPHWQAALPDTWNSLEHHDPQCTRLVHFTDMDGQPWLNPLHALGALWGQYLLDAVHDGAISMDTVRTEVRVGNVRPSVLAQLERGQADPRRLPFNVLRRDLSEFFPPHRRATPRLSRWNHEASRARLLFGHALGEGVVRPVVRGTRRLASRLVSALTPH